MKEFKAKDKFGNEVDFELVENTKKDANDAETQYRLAYSEALKSGFLTRESMLRFMKATGSWSEEFEKEFKDITQKTASAEIKLATAIQEGNDSAATEAATDLTKFRTELWEFIKIKTTPLINSCEGVAEIIKNEALLCFAIRLKGSKNRYWPSYKDYVTERDLNQKSTVAEVMYEVFSEMSEKERMKYFNELPEAQWLERILNDNKNKNRSSEDGKGTEEVSHKPEGQEGDSSVSELGGV